MIIFIVGSSRSGTHLISGILGNNASIFTLPHEIHFFEELYSPAASNDVIEPEQAILLLSKLLDIHRNGYLAKRKERHFVSEASGILRKECEMPLTPLNIFQIFLRYLAAVNGKTIPCEHTPRNIYFIDYILRYIPDARIIHMIRDPRAVLLSQKFRWKRKYLGAGHIPLFEAIRSFMNYHPVTTSLLWNFAARIATRRKDEQGLLTVRYEDIISSPSETVHTICDFLGITYDPGMLQVPHVESSISADAPDMKGIRGKTIGTASALLTATEVRICQQLCSKYMREFQYESHKVRYSYFLMAYYLITAIPKLILAGILSIRRIDSLRSTIVRRFLAGN